MDYDAAVAEWARVMGEYAEWYVDGAAALVDHPQPVTGTVEEIIGRRGMTFAEWAAKNVDVFR